MFQLSATLEVLGSFVEKAGNAKRLQDDLELLKVKKNNLEASKAEAERATKEKENQMKTLKAQHKEKIKKVESELREQKEWPTACEKEFTAKASEIINRFMDTSFFKKRMIAEFAACGIFYRRECIDARIDMRLYVGDNFDLNDPNLELPVIICDLNLLELEKELRKEEEEEKAMRAQETIEQ